MGAVAMVFVGGSVSVSGHLTTAPILTVQSLRYALAAALLLLGARLARQPVPWPDRADWPWLLGVVAAGLVLFNIALVQGSRHAEPTVLGVAISCVPLVLALLAPLAARRTPRVRVVLAAVIVTAGAVLVQGWGRSDGIGLLWAAVVLCCEVGFTVLALPVLRRHNPWMLSVHSCWIAALLFGIGGAWREGPAAASTLTGTQCAAIAFLAVGVTLLAFVLWFSCVRRLGPARAGLLTGIAPAAASLTAVALGQPWPTWGVWAGMAVVLTGLALGLRADPVPEVTSAP